ncbi:MAG TPA: hypothetical protein VIG06_29210 [Kofleriaceae bacterium]
MEELRLVEMDDDRVLERIEALVRRSNEMTAELLGYLTEVEERRLHLREACSSLFAFCVERLHMSESAAGKRITAARVARRFPAVLEMIARGEIHLTAVNMLAAHLTEENHAALLGRARHRSKREIEKLVAEVAPRPDVRSRVVALPQRAATQASPMLPDGGQGGQGGPEGGQGAPERVERAPERVPPEVRARPAVVAPLSPRRYELRVTIDEETHDALVRLQDLLAHQVPGGDPAVIVSHALALLLERTLARKAAATDRPRETAAATEHQREAAAAEKRTRHIPAAVRRAVWQRDQGQCAYLDGKGRRCAATRSLEYHHVRNWARGAEHDPSEIELRCRAHNQYQAVLDYGADFMAARRRGTRAEEPRRAYVPVVRGSADYPPALQPGPSKATFQLPSGWRRQIDENVPICLPAGSSTGPVDRPSEPSALASTRSGRQEKGGAGSAKKPLQVSITCCLPRRVFCAPRKTASSAR